MSYTYIQHAEQAQDFDRQIQRMHKEHERVNNRIDLLNNQIAEIEKKKQLYFAELNRIEESVKQLRESFTNESSAAVDSLARANKEELENIRLWREKQ